MVRHYCDVCGRGIPFAQLDSGYRVTILRADKRKEEEWAEVCGVCVEDLKRWVSSRRPSGTEEEDEEDPDPPGDTDTIERVVRAAIQHVVPDQVPVTERGWIRHPVTVDGIALSDDRTRWLVYLQGVHRKASTTLDRLDAYVRAHGPGTIDLIAEWGVVASTARESATAQSRDQRWNDFEGWRKSRLKSRGEAFNDPPTIDD